jgi:hypothetical protein
VELGDAKFTYVELVFEDVSKVPVLMTHDIVEIYVMVY